LKNFFNEIVIFSGSLTVEEVFKDRDQFASLVREVRGKNLDCGAGAPKSQ
jgi:hypothetical protein